MMTAKYADAGPNRYSARSWIELTCAAPPPPLFLLRAVDLNADMTMENQDCSLQYYYDFGKSSS
eukprot:scaffold8139_cov132-Skeletonema_dohrnii-CCMP3373.AAC.5